MTINVFTYQRIKRSIVWVDSDGKEYKSTDLTDAQLKEVCIAASNGAGYPFFICRIRNILRLYRIARKRKVLPKKHIKYLCQVVLYIHGHRHTWPRGIGCNYQ